MVQYYSIFGQKVGSHILSIATLGTMSLGSWLAMRGGEKTKEQGPPINARSKEEEQFIQEFLRNAEAEEKKENAAQ